MPTQSYSAADLGTITRKQGDGGLIDLTIPVIFSLVGKIVRAQIRNDLGELLHQWVQPTTITVSGQQILIDLLAADFVGIDGTHRLEIQAEYTGGPTTLAFGQLKIPKDYCHV